MAINSMDTRIERKSRFKKKHIYSLIGIAVGLLCLLWLLFRDTSSSLKVEKERITIATVQKGEFNDYIRVIGQVLPDRIIYLDVIEGGRVEERLIEEGAQVRAGDVILRLSNPLLNIGILQSEADLAYQENELRNTHLSMEQEHLRLKQDRIGLSKELVQKERRFRQYERLYKKNLLAREDYLQAEEDYEAALGQLAVVDERIEQDDLFRSSQLQSLDENIRNMKKSLALVRGATGKPESEGSRRRAVRKPGGPDRPVHRPGRTYRPGDHARTEGGSQDRRALCGTCHTRSPCELRT